MNLLVELRRRNVFRVAIAYVVLSWLILQMGDLLFDLMDLPDWSLRIVLGILVLGLVPAVVFSWVYELTPEGIQKESEVDRNASTTPQTSRRLDIVVIVMLVLAFALFGLDRLGVMGGGSSSGPSSADRASLPPAAEDGALPVVAVLPFKTLAAGEEGRFLASGLHDDLLTRLARLRAFRVISRTSVMQYAGSAPNMREIGEQLGAAYVMEGGLQALAGRVRINAQLIDTRTDEHLWAETFDRPLTTANLFDVQSEIAGAIAHSMRSALSASDVSMISEVPTQNMDAYRAYLTGLEVDGPLTREAMDATVAAFRRAVVLDSQFGEAWAYLAQALIRNYWEQGGEQGRSPPLELREQAHEALERAQQLAPDNPATLVASSFYHYYGFRDYSKALIELGKAEAVAPNFATVIALRGYLLRRLGRFEEAADALGQVLLVDPNSSAAARELISTLWVAGSCDRASTAAHQALVRHPGSVGVLHQAAWVALVCDHDLDTAVSRAEQVEVTTLHQLNDVVRILAYAGRWESALERLRAYEPGSEGQPIAVLTVASGAHWLKRRLNLEPTPEALAAALATVEALPPVGTAGFLLMGRASALLGNRDAALQYGARAVDALPKDAFLQPQFLTELVELYAEAGAFTQALSYLRELAQSGAGRRQAQVEINPYLDPLRGAAEFTEATGG